MRKMKNVLAVQGNANATKLGEVGRNGFPNEAYIFVKPVQLWIPRLGLTSHRPEVRSPLHPKEQRKVNQTGELGFIASECVPKGMGFECSAFRNMFPWLNWQRHRS
jgi:hypothetical protein